MLWVSRSVCMWLFLIMDADETQSSTCQRSIWCMWCYSERQTAVSFLHHSVREMLRQPDQASCHHWQLALWMWQGDVLQCFCISVGSFGRLKIRESSLTSCTSSVLPLNISSFKCVSDRLRFVFILPRRVLEAFLERQQRWGSSLCYWKHHLFLNTHFIQEVVVDTHFGCLCYYFSRSKLSITSQWQSRNRILEVLVKCMEKGGMMLVGLSPQTVSVTLQIKPSCIWLLQIINTKLLHLTWSPPVVNTLDHM